MLYLKNMSSKKIFCFFLLFKPDEIFIYPRNYSYSKLKRVDYVVSVATSGLSTIMWALSYVSFVTNLNEKITKRTLLLQTKIKNKPVVINISWNRKKFRKTHWNSKNATQTLPGFWFFKFCMHLHVQIYFYDNPVTLLIWQKPRMFFLIMFPLSL